MSTPQHAGHSVVNRDDDEHHHSDEETIALYEFEEVEDQSVQMKKKLFLTDYILTNDDRNDESSKGHVFSKLAKFISTIYDGMWMFKQYTLARTRTLHWKLNLNIVSHHNDAIAYIKSEKLANDDSNINYRQAIIEKYQQNWSIEYSSTGLYTLKDSTLKLHNEDMVPIASAKSLEWMDARKILSVNNNFVSVTNCDDGTIRIYSSDLKSQIGLIDLSTFLHFDKSPLFRSAISNVKLQTIASTERYVSE